MRPHFSLLGSLALASLTTLSLTLTSPGTAEAQPASPVVDLNTVQEDLAPYVFVGRDFVTLGSTVYFIQDDGIHGIELWKSNGTAAGTLMVKDVCPGACAGWPSSLTVSQGMVYFAAQDGVHGQELWRTDGTASGTVLVKDLRPGTGNGLTTLFDAGGILYLAANDGVHGNELWKSDGTSAGTLLVADVRPGPESSDPAFMLNVQGLGPRLLFNADDGVHGREPWLTNGTTAGTALLKDVNPGTGDSSFQQTNVGFENDAYALGVGAFFFTADDGVHGVEPWRSDGTAGGTFLVKDVNPGSAGSQAYGFKGLGNRVVFGAYTDSISWELWATDGTEPGTVPVKDINPSFGSNPRQLTPLGGRLVFVAGSASGRELWSTDGTAAGTSLVKDINPGTADGFSPFVRTVLRAGGAGLLFFADDGVHGNELWTSDGTEAGTRLVKDVAPGSVPGALVGYAGITLLGSTAYFQGYTPDHGLELWKSDGTEAGTVEVKNATVVKSSLPAFSGYLDSTFGRLGGRFVFDANDGVSGVEPYTTDGTAANTQQLADLNPGLDWGGPSQLFPAAGLLYGRNSGDLWRSDGTPGGTAPVVPLGTVRAESSLVQLGTSWYFAGNDSSGGSELWKTDGTAGGTQRVRDVLPGSNNGIYGDPIVFGSVLLFSGNDGTGYELWKSDGTFAGTTLVKDLATGPFGGSPAEFTPLGPLALFTANQSMGTYRDLWVTDGTPTGTVLLQQNVGGLVRLGSTVLFVGNDATAGRELWKSDGTPAGTVLLRDIQPGAGSGFPAPYFNEGNFQTVVGNAFFFLADDGTNGAELWKSDGTAAGTVLVKDVYPGAPSSEITWMTRVRNRLYFVADDGVHGRELWVSDGTEAGTRLVKDIVPGAGSSVAQHLAALGHLVLFNATDGVTGVEPWKSDGTEAGTALLQDLAPGAASSSAVGFYSAFPTVYFAANDNVAGFELWSLPRATLGSTFPDVPPTHWAWQWVEMLADAGLTTGCGDGLYCPDRSVTRAETAAFLLRGLHGTGFVPPLATGTRFDDVPAAYWAAPWIEQLATEGLTTGCSLTPPLFCPESSTARDQMAVLLLRAVHGSAYVPPPPTGTRFTDVPATYWAAAWIEQLAAEGITNGCTLTTYCPADPVSRDQMAVFLSRAFHLPLP